MKMQTFNFGEIMNKNKNIKFKIQPRYYSKTITDIEYLILQYLSTGDLQYLDSKFDFAKYGQYLEDNLNSIIRYVSVKVEYPFILIKRHLGDKYEVAILFNFSCTSRFLYNLYNKNEHEN